METVEEKTKLLKKYFSKRPEILMAFVFGSYSKGQETSESDFDVAVYFKPEGKMLEWEETKLYSEEDEIWGDVEKIIGLRTDFVVLNRAPSTLAFSIIQKSIPIIIKDNSLYLRFFLTISSAAEYFMEFTEDFWKIKQRSKSLTNIDKERLIRTVDFLETELADYNKFVDISQELYEADAPTRRNVERWVENIVNSSIDAAKIILASEKKRIPQTYREVLWELAIIKDFDQETAKKLSRFAKLRNTLAHEYLDIRFHQIKKFIQESEPAYKELLRFAKNFINK